MIKQYNADVLIIGAGPSGALAATLLCQGGLSVCILERQTFPRFSIGESLLPQCMDALEKTGALPKIEKSLFQLKKGAAFQKGDQHCEINFSEKSAPGWSTTFQVKRAEFDKILADHAESVGGRIFYGHTVELYEEEKNGVTLKGVSEDGTPYEATGRFVLDASGFGRVLPRMLGLDRPSSFPPRQAVFSHIMDNIDHPEFDRDKILITIHKKDPSIWYWLIPFSDNTASIGAVGKVEDIEKYGSCPKERLVNLIKEDDHYQKIMPNYTFLREVGEIKSYACSVSKLYGEKFALLGNAGEFLDPVFSSGVTISFKSAELAASNLLRQFRGEKVDWQKEYADALMKGVDTFRSFVLAWYEETLQKIILNIPSEHSSLKAMIISVLAGYAWDPENKFCSEKAPALLENICALMVKK